LDIFGIFGGRVGVIESQVADATWIFFGNSKVEADGFGMTDMEIPIWFGRKSGDDPTTMFAGSTVPRHDVSNEIRGT
jgi:hypothetical protein